jgi:hypothetical protein
MHDILAVVVAAEYQPSARLHVTSSHGYYYIILQIYKEAFWNGDRLDLPGVRYAGLIEHA